jgi:DNA invertase Pin-like site-specific DNA recombinase
MQPFLMLGVFAEFETNMRRERQLEGIARLRPKASTCGRKPTIDVEKVRELHAQGLGATEITKTLGIGRTSVYRGLDETA